MRSGIAATTRVGPILPTPRGSITSGTARKEGPARARTTGLPERLPTGTGTSIALCKEGPPSVSRRRRFFYRCLQIALGAVISLEDGGDVLSKLYFWC